ncbi:hypothetical protein GCM10010193_28600 [Kitasatospora atroaurantiaca]|uniref:FAD-dependent oxidoreductase n=1 Tax=Kitasatospora atroaurantiaca TaxID=285545 RepID=UPI00119E11F9|nr:FAD-dependent oxidoreductase [Kitasatospora atroaurantiaca]
MAVDADVAVVGAGPVGLSAALLLARAGLGVVVLERRPGPVTESRATDLHARTLEALAPSGLAESLHPLGRRVDTVEMWSQGRRLGGFELARLRSPYPYILTVPQCATEGLLAAEAERAGVRVHRSAAVRSVDEDADCVTVRSDALDPLRARWVVAADGASSTLRALAGTAFRGRTYAGTWQLADLRVEDPSLDPARVHMVGGPRGLLVVLPMHLDGWARVVLHLPHGPAPSGADGAAVLAAEAAARGGRRPFANADGRVPSAPTGASPHTTGAGGCCRCSSPAPRRPRARSAGSCCAGSAAATAWRSGGCGCLPTPSWRVCRTRPARWSTCWSPPAT